MEPMNGGTLFKRIEKNKKYSEKDAVEAIKQIVSAVEYLHSLSIIHRDLKVKTQFNNKA